MVSAESDWTAPQRRLEALMRGENDGARHRGGSRFWRRMTGAIRRHPKAMTQTARLEPGVYILAYHGIVDESRMREWERCYRKGTVSLANFQDQVAVLLRHLTPAALTEVPGIFAHGRPDRAYGVFTFDDGYSNLVENVRPIFRSNGISPTVFLNGRFAEGGVYYRVLAALLTAKGEAGALREALRAAVPDVAWDGDPSRLFNQTKDHYRPGLVEQAVDAAYRARLGDPADLGVHLTVKQVRELQDGGWTFGDHTFGHTMLSELTDDEVEMACGSNRDFWRRGSVTLIDWLAYPNGRSIDVGPGLVPYFDRNPSLHGIFCNGGINLVRSRHAWLRSCPANRSGEETLAQITREAELSKIALLGEADE